MVNFGNNSINLTSIYQGSNSIPKLYYGSNLLFPNITGPNKINDYLEQYTWLQADGKTYIPAYRPIPGSNINKSPNVTLKAVLKVTAFDSLLKVDKICSISGASSVIDNVRGRYLSISIKKLNEDTFSVGYFGCVPMTSELEFFGNYKLGDIINIEGKEKSVTINGITYEKTTEETKQNLSMLSVLHSVTALGDRPYAGQIASLEYIANGITYSSLVPAKVIKELPTELAYDGKIKEIGTLGMWDKINNKFLTSSATNNWEVLL